MAQDHIRYDILTQEALRGVVRKVLSEVGKTGLPGEHHFFISFLTKAPGVRITSHRRDERQRELTLDVEFLEAAAPAPASPGHSSTAFGWFVVLGTTGAIVAGVSGRRRLMAPPQRPKSA